MSRESETRAATTRSAQRLRAATIADLLRWALDDPEAQMELGRRVAEKPELLDQQECDL